MRAAVFVVVLLAACASAAAPEAQQAAQGAAIPPMFTRPGYLDRTAYPDSVALLPPPPEPGSAGFARDEAARDAAQRLRNTPRWTQAATDADLSRTNPPDAFSCAAGMSVSAEATPRLHALLMRSGVDFGFSIYGAKNHYRRARPFMLHNTTTCSPADETYLRRDGAYPSGHTAIGWGWALILAELLPERADAILQRGRDFGQSRVICDAHWQSDVDGGRLLASTVVARLHADATFRADLEAAHAELAGSDRPAPAANVCTAEAAALRTP